MGKIAFTKAELLRLASIAKEQGVAVSLERDGTRVTIAPWQGEAGIEPSRQAAGGLLIAPPPPPLSEFDHREQTAMELLVATGVGVPTYIATMAGVGPHTCQKLVERGYAEVLDNETGRPSGERVALTRKGLQDWKALGSYYERYPAL